MEFGVLGSVEAYYDQRQITIGHARQRCVLAVILVEAGRPVPADLIVERVWGPVRPPTAIDLVYGYVSRLRRALRDVGGPALVRRSGGYALDIDSESVDLHRFRRLVTEARGEDDSRAEDLLSQALKLWRGSAFADVASPWIDELRQVLEDERVAAALDRNDVELRRGHAANVLAELRRMHEVNPLDERLLGQLVTAAYRCGRQAEALGLYERIRLRLAHELGVDPSPQLQSLYHRILRNDAALTRPVLKECPAPPPNPAQLPHNVRHFAGREQELAQIRSLSAAAAPDGAMVICAINGIAGVGKTALAVHAAHQMADHFTDGQLYADLGAFEEGRPPRSPEEVLDQFVRALGATPESVPEHLEEKAALYRSLAAGRRLLVVVDNAANSRQVRPLLPGVPGCLVIVTSRNRLVGLVARHGAHHVTLDTLSLDDAVSLLARIIGADRIAAQPEAAVGVARLCRCLPLAICMAAERLVYHPHQALSAM
jgi:DNA-binding SARP family transcriptional activator